MNANITERLRRVSGNSPLAKTTHEAADAIDEMASLLRACLNMVEGDGLPPNWDMIRAALRKAGAL